jgi:uncharacterized protein (TIGR02246 family)
MTQYKRLGAAAALVVAAGVVTFAWAAGKADPGRAAEDRAEIEGLMWRYVRALDTHDAAAYAACYTEDGTFQAGSGNVTKGRAALKKLIEDGEQRAAERAAKGEKAPQMYHVSTNVYVELVDADHARYHAYWQGVFESGGANVPARVGSAGHELTDIVRVNGKWLIAKRDVGPGDRD